MLPDVQRLKSNLQQLRGSLSHTEPLEHLFDDGFRSVFAGQVAERIQRVIHADRDGVQPKTAGGGIQCPGYGVPGAEGGG